MKIEKQSRKVTMTLQCAIEFLKNSNTDLPYDLAILLPDMYPKELKTAT